MKKTKAKSSKKPKRKTDKNNGQSKKGQKLKPEQVAGSAPSQEPVPKKRGKPKNTGLPQSQNVPTDVVTATTAAEHLGWDGRRSARINKGKPKCEELQYINCNSTPVLSVAQGNIDTVTIDETGERDPLKAAKILSCVKNEIKEEELEINDVASEDNPFDGPSQTNSQFNSSKIVSEEDSRSAKKKYESNIILSNKINPNLNISQRNAATNEEACDDGTFLYSQFSNLDIMYYSNVLKVMGDMFINKENSFEESVLKDSIFKRIYDEIVESNASDTEKIELMKKLAYGITLFRKIKNKDPTTLSLQSCFNPGKLYVLLDTIKELCSNFEQFVMYGSPVEALSWFFFSAGSKITSDTMSVLQGEKETIIRDVNIVLEVIKSNWVNLSCFNNIKTVNTAPGTIVGISPLLVAPLNPSSDENNAISGCLLNDSITSNGQNNGSLVNEHILAGKNTVNQSLGCVVSKANKKGCDGIKKKNYCSYCDKTVTKFWRHVLGSHSEEKEVKFIASLLKEKNNIEVVREGKNLIKELRLRNNYEYTKKLLATKSFDESPPSLASAILFQNYKMSKSGPKELKNIVRCSFCKGIYGRNSFCKHLKQCYSKKKFDKSLVQANHENETNDVVDELPRKNKMKIYYCLFCEEVFTGSVKTYIKHVLFKHHDREPITQYITLMKDKTKESKVKRKKMLRSFRLKCNIAYMRKCTKNKFSSIVFQKPQTQNIHEIIEIPSVLNEKTKSTKGSYKNKNLVPAKNQGIKNGPLDRHESDGNVNTVERKNKTKPKKRNRNISNHTVELDINRDIKMIDEDFTQMLQNDSETRLFINDDLIKSIIFKYEHRLKIKSKLFHMCLFKRLKLGCKLFSRLKEKDPSLNQIYNCFVPSKKEILFDTLRDICSFIEVKGAVGLRMPSRLLSFTRDAKDRALKDEVLKKSMSKRKRRELIQGTAEVMNFLSNMKFLSSKNIPAKDSKCTYKDDMRDEKIGIRIMENIPAEVKQSCKGGNENCNILPDNDGLSQNPMAPKGHDERYTSNLCEVSSRIKDQFEKDNSLDRQSHTFVASCPNTEVINVSPRQREFTSNHIKIAAISTGENQNHKKYTVMAEKNPIDPIFLKENRTTSSSVLNTNSIFKKINSGNKMRSSKRIDKDKLNSNGYSLFSSSSKTKQNYCSYCKKLVKNLTRHIRKWHANEKEIKLILNLLQDKNDKEAVKEGRALLKEMRIRNNLTYTNLLLAEKSMPELIGNSSYEEHWTSLYNCKKLKGKALKDVVRCMFCLGHYTRINFCRHIKKCFSKKKYEREKNLRKQQMNFLLSKNKIRHYYCLFFKKIHRKYFKTCSKKIYHLKNKDNKPDVRKAVKHPLVQTHLLKSSILSAKHHCLFCKESVSKFTNHVLIEHKDKEPVVQYLALVKENTEDSIKKAKKILRLLHLKSCNAYLTKCLNNNKNTQSCKISQSPSGSSEVSEDAKKFNPGKLTKSALTSNKHTAIKNGIYNINASSSVRKYGSSVSFNIDPRASPKLREMVLGRIKLDQSSIIALQDPLLMATASHILHKKMKTNKSTNINNTLSFIRFGGRLLKCIKSLDETITEFRDLLNPSKIDTVFEATKEICGLDEKTGNIKIESVPFRSTHVINQASEQFIKDTLNNKSLHKDEKNKIKKEIEVFLDLKRKKFRSIIARWPGSKKRRTSISSQFDTCLGIEKSHDKRRKITTSESEVSSSEECERIYNQGDSNSSAKDKCPTFTKKKWTDGQKRIVIIEFKDFIMRGTNPGRQRCRELIASHPELAGRTADQVNLIIDNINKMKLKLPPEFEHLRNLH